jgi:hypothetical protein
MHLETLDLEAGTNHITDDIYNLVVFSCAQLSFTVTKEWLQWLSAIHRSIGESLRETLSWAL